MFFSDAETTLEKLAEEGVFFENLQELCKHLHDERAKSDAFVPACIVQIEENESVPKGFIYRIYSDVVEILF